MGTVTVGKTIEMVDFMFCAAYDNGKSKQVRWTDSPHFVLLGSILLVHNLPQCIRVMVLLVGVQHRKPTSLYKPLPAHFIIKLPKMCLLVNLEQIRQGYKFRFNQQV